MMTQRIPMDDQDGPASRAWIKCGKTLVQDTKRCLEKHDLLSRECKVKKYGESEFMIVPSTILTYKLGLQKESTSSTLVSKEITTSRAEEEQDIEKLNEALQDLIHDQSSLQEISIIYIPITEDGAAQNGTQGSRYQDQNRNSLSSAISAWLSQLPTAILDSPDGSTTSFDLLSMAPKRWSIYSPMLLLPAGSFQGHQWDNILRKVGHENREELWKAILTAVGGEVATKQLTHLAINAGIPLHSRSHSEMTENLLHGEDTDENVLRSPSGMLMLYGDFGPAGPEMEEQSQDQAHAQEHVQRVSRASFEKAFWVQVTQNGIHQTWAPRWTMFSRGNITEKARLLRFHSPPSAGVPTTVDERLSALINPHIVAQRRERVAASLHQDIAIDLYAGIGYFAFCYAKLGMTVLCWEINPWSVEGLRRGGQKNGWDVTVVHHEDDVSSDFYSEGARITAFLEGNEHALTRLKRFRRKDGSVESGNAGLKGIIRHVNCGFLPTSEPSWRSAWDIVDKKHDCWLHLHENVALVDIGKRRQEIEDLFHGWAGGLAVIVEVEHIELVKTYAPGVWHCVFDVYVGPKDGSHLTAHDVDKAEDAHEDVGHAYMSLQRII